jgi:hypothetical protein
MGGDVDREGRELDTWERVMELLMELYDFIGSAGQCDIMGRGWTVENDNNECCKKAERRERRWTDS